MTDRGLFIVFEGGDGSGKTTQIRLLAERLRALGREVVETVEPGGTPIGNKIRAILLDRAHTELCPRAELLLYFAARAQNVEQVILPALVRGAIVLADRYTGSTLAYQGAGRGLGADLVLCLHDIACQGLWPKLTIYLDVDPAAGLARRAAAQDINRLDAEALEFHERVRREYRQLAAAQPDRIRQIDGGASIDAVAAAIWEAVSPHV
jgi:dTMP kinase